MKRLLILMTIIIPFLIMTSCDDENEFPDITLKVKVENAVKVGNTIYLVKDQPLEISSVALINNSGKNAVIGSVSYFWDYYFVGKTVMSPYGITIDTDTMPVGRHILQMRVPIYVVGNPAYDGFVEYTVVIVNSEDDMPSLE